MNTDPLTHAIAQMINEGASPGEIAKVLVAAAHATLEIDDPHQAPVRLMYMAGRVSGMAKEVESRSH